MAVAGPELTREGPYGEKRYHHKSKQFMSEYLNMTRDTALSVSGVTYINMR